MSYEKESLDQAQNLRERMNNIENDDPSKEDVLELPPRSKAHKARDENKKAKFKFKYPVVRMLALLFILIPIALLSLTFYIKSQEQVTTKTVSKQTEYEEEISFDKKENLQGSIQNDTQENTVEVVEDTSKEEQQQEVADKEEKTVIEKENEHTLSENVKNNNYDIVFHTVKEGETLFSISQQYYKNRSGELLIKNQNKLNGNEIEVGQILEIPLEMKK
jgi:LysM repeat protein